MTYADTIQAESELKSIAKSLGLSVGSITSLSDAKRIRESVVKLRTSVEQLEAENLRLTQSLEST